MFYFKNSAKNDGYMGMCLLEIRNIARHKVDNAGTEDETGKHSEQSSDTFNKVV